MIAAPPRNCTTKTLCGACAGSASDGALPSSGRSSRRMDCVRPVARRSDERTRPWSARLRPGWSRPRLARAKHSRTASQDSGRSRSALGCDLLGPLMSGSPDRAVVLNDVTFAYDGRPAVQHLSGAFLRGSLTAIVGPNGSGKTTLLKGMVGLLRPADGLIQSARLGGGGIAYLPQQIEIERRFPISVIQTVLLGHWRRIGWAGAATRELRAQAQRAL